MARSSILTDRRAATSRDVQLDLLKSLGPDGITKEVATLTRKPKTVPSQLLLPHLIMPEHHEVRSSDVVMRRLRGSLAAAASCEPRDFPELLLVPGVGARTVRALAFRWSMARPVGSPIQRDSRWPMEEKTIIPFQCHYASTTKRFAC